MEQKDSCAGVPELAIATVKKQEMQELYPLDRALQAGTIFPELDKPFFMGGKTL